jgi:hypothetical protein
VTNDTTDASYYIYDPTNKWRHIATINSPNGRNKRGSTFREVCSWIENFAGRNMAEPKIALYSMWTGSSPETLKHVTRVYGESGSGRWGQLNDTYFLAEGSKEQLEPVFAKYEPKYGKPVFGVDGNMLPPVTNKLLSASLIQELKNLPKAPSVN